MIVIDASAVIELLFQTAVGKKVGEIIFESKLNIIAPELLSIETIQVIRKFISSKELSYTRAEQAFNDLSDLPITYYPHNILLDRIWSFRNNFTAYDSTYLALAENLKTPLLTTDSAFKKGFGKIHHVKIIYIKI